jgi:hypothetical protein
MILKIVLVVVLALGAGNVYQYIAGKWSSAGYKKQITELQNERTELRVTEEKNRVEIERLKKKQVIKRRVSNEQEKVDVEVGDPTAVVDFFRVRRKGEVPAAPDGGKGGPRPPARRAPRIDHK